MNGELQLLEFVQGSRPEKVDREKGIIYGVKLLGESSRNPPPHNHLYPETTRRAAIPIFEGKQVCVDHPSPDQAAQVRSYTAGMGLIRNVRETGDGLYGDWHFPPKHALAESVFWDSENNPRGPGFSINGNAGSKRRTDAGMIVESIESLETIDLVSRPATTAGLRESQRPPMKYKVRDLIESLKNRRPGYSRALREMAEAGLMTPDTQAEAPMGDPPADPAGSEPGDADHEVALKQGFKGAMGAVLDDDSMDMKSKLQKLKEIMQAQEKLMGGGKGAKGGKGDACPPGEKKDDPGAKGGKGDDDGKKDDDAMESLRLQNRALHLLMESGIRPDRVLSKALEGCRTEAEIKELIEAGKGRGQTSYNGARSAPAGVSATAPVQEAAIPATAAEWGKSLLE